ncbi:MAG: GNAT family N-acetyltransferase [Verrucomicrobiota bacterium]
MLVERLGRADLSRSDNLELISLWEEVWPQAGGSVEEKLADAERKTEAAAEQKGDLSERIHRLHVEGRLVAVCRTFLREIQYVDTGENTSVLALASVCTKPVERGNGFGRRVVEDAFRRLEDEGIGLSLFQTGVPDFYRKMGCRTVSNRFLNSFADNPEATPWWDDWAVIYPAEANWREAPVDLRGAGY